MAGILDVGANAAKTVGSAAATVGHVAASPFKIAGGTVAGGIKGIFSPRTLVGAGIGAVVGFAVGGPVGAAVGALKGGAIAGAGLGAVAGGGKAALDSLAKTVGGPFDDMLAAQKASKRATESASDTAPGGEKKGGPTFDLTPEQARKGYGFEA